MSNVHFADPVREQPAISAHAATGGFFVEFRALKCPSLSGTCTHVEVSLV